MNNTTNSTALSTFLDYALHYAALGFHVFPVPPGTKAGYSDLTEKITGRRWGNSKDPDEVRRMFTLHPEANIGIATGVDSNLFVFEADTIAGHGVDGIASVAALEADHGPLPATLQGESPSGSIHHYFRYPGFHVSSSASIIGVGIDVKGDGGMVLAPPSVRDGVAYKWLNPETPIADAPQWLKAAVRTPERIRTTVAPSLDGYRYEEVLWWAERNADVAWSQEDWAMFGGALKLHFGDEGLDVFLLVSRNASKAGDRFDRFPAQYKEGNRTLHWYLDRDIAWMFRSILGCPMPPDVPPPPPRLGAQIVYPGGAVKVFSAAGWVWDERYATVAQNAGAPPATLPPGATPMFGEGARTPQIVGPEYAEIEIADRFVNDVGSNIRHIAVRDAWLFWTGKRWRVDDTNYVPNLAREHCRNEAALCASRPGSNNARTLSSNRTVQAVLRLASMDQRVATRVEDWDQDPWLIGCPDGVVDLRTGTLRGARPEDHITKSTAVTPSGDCPTWLRFIDQMTNGDKALAQYLQNLSGYWLTGSTREQELHFGQGPGNTGKGTFSRATQGILADYHKAVNVRTLTASKQDRHLAEVAVLQGARLVTCSETERGNSWAEGRLKEWTGEDKISANFMGKNPFHFTPTFKLFITGNHKPRLRPDSAMRRRFRLVPFVHVILAADVDRSLSEKLHAEWPGIFGWMIQGAVLWQNEGLVPPACVTEATKDYMDGEAADTLTMWIEDKCDTKDQEVRTQIAMLYNSYKMFAEVNGERNILSSEQLSRALGELGHRKDDNKDRLTGLPPLPPGYSSGVVYTDAR
jgi:P4 family phage/plasmid primase-like protien